MTLFLLSLSVLAGPWIQRLTDFPAAWLWSLALWAWFGVIQTNYLSLLQVRKEASRFVANNLVGSFLNMLFSIVLVVSFHMDWRGRLWAQVLAGVFMAALCLWGFGKRLHLLSPKMDFGALQTILRFGIPLIPHTIGGLVMTMVARLALNHMASVAETGLFSVAYNLASPIQMLVGAANKAYVPELFERLSNPAADQQKLCRVLLGVAAALPFLGILSSIGVCFLLPWLVGPKFQGAAPYVFWLSLGMAVQGIYYIFGNFVVYSKRTELMAWRGDFAGAIAILILCPLFIHWMGGVGAAIANTAAITVSTIGCISAARKAHPMPWKKSLSLKDG